jgi:hypothetical protein
VARSLAGIQAVCRQICGRTWSRLTMIAATMATHCIVKLVESLVGYGIALIADGNHGTRISEQRAGFRASVASRVRYSENSK